MGEREYRWFCRLLWFVAIMWGVIGLIHLVNLLFTYGTWKGLSGDY